MTKSNYLGIRIVYYSLIVLSLGGIALSVHLLFLPLLAAFLLSMLLRPVVNYFETKGLSQLGIIVGIYTVVSALLILLIVLITPMLVGEIKILAGKLPTYFGVAKNYVLDLKSWVETTLPFVPLPDASLLSFEGIAGKVDDASALLTKSLSSIITLLSFALIVPFISFFILKDSHLIERTLLSLVPNRYFEMVVLIFHRIIRSVQLYIRGQIIDATFVGTMTAVGLTIVGFPFALVIGLIAGIGNLIPYLGPILGSIPAIFIIIVSPEWQGVWPVLSVLLVFVTVQAIENVFVYPLAVGGSVNLHPLVIVIALLVGGQLGGILGMVIAIPLVAIVKVTFQVVNQYMREYKIL